MQQEENVIGIETSFLLSSDQQEKILIPILSQKLWIKL